MSYDKHSLKHGETTDFRRSPRGSESPNFGSGSRLTVQDRLARLERGRVSVGVGLDCRAEVNAQEFE